MKTNFKHFIPYLTAMALMFALVIALTACSSPSTPSSSLTAPSTAQPTASAPAQSTVPVPNGSAQRQGAGVNGTLAKIDGNTLTLNTPQGQVTLNVASDTSIQKTVLISLADLQAGQFLTVIGTVDAGGNIAAGSIAVRAQDLSPRFTPPTGITPNPGGRPTRPSGSTSPGPDNNGPGNGLFGSPGNGAFGTLAKIDGNTLTLTTGQGQQVTVTVGSNTAVQKTESGNISDLQMGESLTAMGNRDANGNINAVSITIRPEDASSTGP